MADTRIVLVRHGQSQAQDRRFVGGHDGCTGLSDLGRRQVGALASRLAESGELAGATALYASVMARAVETAQILAPALGDLEVRPECAFCESHPGREADGLSWDEFNQRWPLAVEEWTPRTRRDPGSESYEEMRDRVVGRLGALVERHEGETVVVACHGGVVMHSMFHWLELDPVRARTRAWLNPVNSSITEWRLADHPYWGSGVELVRFNDHAHLRADLLAHA
ncbi:MAG TPA: histidine phosphatase family protein [Mycobacteriales bacterium]